MIELDDVRAAARRLEGVAHRTPVLTSRRLDERCGCRVLLKAENHQRAGAFKFRGAYNKLASLSEEERACGVITASSGNHAQALALAAGLFGARAVVLMPIDAPASKAAATAGYGAEIVPFDRYTVDREALLAEEAEARGMTIVHPYDDPAIMAGQGTAALELLEDGGPLDVLLVCVGGGGLIAGCATAAKALEPGIRVVGVEPAASADTQQSLAAGHRVDVDVAPTIADGQQLNTPGALTFEVIRRRVDEVAVVSDPEIVDAMVALFETVKTVVEPSGASALAALLAEHVSAPGQRVGVTLSGGNVDAARFTALVAGR